MSTVGEGEYINRSDIHVFQLLHATYLHITLYSNFPQSFLEDHR